MANTQKTPWEAFNRDTDLCYSIATASCDEISVLNNVTTTSATTTSADCSIKAPKTISALKINGENFRITPDYTTVATVDSVSTISDGLKEAIARIAALEDVIAKPQDTLGTLRRTLKTLSYTKELD